MTGYPCCCETVEQCEPCGSTWPAEMQMHVPAVNGTGCCESWVGSWVLSYEEMTFPVLAPKGCSWITRMTPAEATSLGFVPYGSGYSCHAGFNTIEFRLWPGIASPYPNHGKWELYVDLGPGGFGQTQFMRWRGPDLDDLSVADCTAWQDVEFDFFDMTPPSLFVCYPDRVYFTAL